MDERLQKALEFSNYTISINNQKQNLRNRLAQMQILHYSGGTFLADAKTISFLGTLVQLGHTSAQVIIDNKNNPVHVMNVQELLEKLVYQYQTAAQEYEQEFAKVKKARNIKRLMVNE